MYSLFESAMSVIAPGTRPVASVRVHVEAQISREPIVGARVRVNSGPWQVYGGPEDPIVAEVANLRRVRVEVAMPGWIDPRPTRVMDFTHCDEVHIGLM